MKIEILCWRIMTPSLRGGSISLGYLATGPPRRRRKPTLQRRLLLTLDMLNFKPV
ncbi:hypothetical protein CBUD_0354a [Coxiella burnetii Dugway 5J108-111]|uniref:Uncharacterized protein n=1 Tax=Coxiella burnetii (strain Dugway 5J108-111) TaxID=434922 RepID=B5XHR1_COXBN|nr:hypothetical protein CBUD_0354a [Coxiella burnetii Dugway 5J108-111]